VVLGDFNTSLLPIDRSSKQKNQWKNSRTKSHHKSNGPSDVYRIFDPTSAQYTFFSVVHGTFSKIDHIVGNKTSLSKYKKIEIIPCILSDHNALKLELNNKKQQQKICQQFEADQHIAKWAKGH
jgi:exonuclease III